MTTHDIRVRLPNIPAGFHAFLLADVQVRDPGSGSLLDIMFTDGLRVRARASAEVLRLGTRLNGLFRATLHFRTDDDARLREPLHLYRLRPMDYPLAYPSKTYWSAAGVVLTHPDTLLVFLEKARATPFQIRFKRQLPLLPFDSASHSLRASGVLIDGQLIATELHVVQPLEIAARWHNWQFP